MAKQSKYAYFNRDVSWLAFNFRVLEEARSTDISVSERIRFLSIYSSNLIEFYSVRVAEYRQAANNNQSIEDVIDPLSTLAQINQIVSDQMREVDDILYSQIRPALEAQGVRFHLGEMPHSEVHLQFMRDYFESEIIPYLQPLVLSKATRVFLRNDRPYFALKVYPKNENNNSVEHLTPHYALVKLPIHNFPRFVQLPDIGDGFHHLVFLDDIIRLSVHTLFPGYDVDGVWCMKVARDADLGLLDLAGQELVDRVRHSSSRRNTGAESSFYVDSDIAPDLLGYLEETFCFSSMETVNVGHYLSLNQLEQFPSHLLKEDKTEKRVFLRPKRMHVGNSIFSAIKQRDQILHYPYQSFDYVIRFLSEAAIDPKVKEIKISLYRVCHNSAIINSLIAAAAHNQKRVTAFIELKARFDEHNNLDVGEMLKQSGVKVIYSLPKLKVHAKMAMVIREEDDGSDLTYAYLSTGNFNEKTAEIYTDHGLFTADREITSELHEVFDFLEDQSRLPRLNSLLMSQFNMVYELRRLIQCEIAKVNTGGEGYILLKMNGMQNHMLIDMLYEASLAGVKIDLIIRGVSCLVPEQPYSSNITVRRIIDRYLEHGRVWVFGKGEESKMYLTSSDWLNRNIGRRIELAFPIKDRLIKNEIQTILDLQLKDNVKARILNKMLKGIKPSVGQHQPEMRAQDMIFEELTATNDR
ncbi:MAG: polyphosphate kinase 1 [Bacteroidales bacterium]|nr:polyphosphate kinase 1 [Bacteroidales bacterium]